VAAKPAPKADAHATAAKPAPKTDAPAAPSKVTVTPETPAAAAKPAAKDAAELERIARAVAAAVAADPQTARAAMAARAAARAAAIANAVDMHTGAAQPPVRASRPAPPRPPMRRVPVRWPDALTRWDVMWPAAATGRVELAWPSPVPEPLTRRAPLDVLTLSRATPGPTFVVDPDRDGRARTIVRPMFPEP
jgi:hypothetical protein